MSARRPLDPRICNIAIDANALDRDGSSRDRLVDQFLELQKAGTLTVVVAGGVRDEILHPRTPTEVRSDILPQIFNLRAQLNAGQQLERRRVASIVQGNARPETHAADASHLSEAAETGCAYFITHDGRILAKRDQLECALPPSLTVVSLTEFMEILEDYTSGTSSDVTAAASDTYST